MIIKRDPNIRVIRTIPIRAIILSAFMFVSAYAEAQPPARNCAITAGNHDVRLESGTSVIEVELLQSNVLRVDVQPRGERSPRTAVLEPGLKAAESLAGTVRAEGNTALLSTREMTASVGCADEPSITVSDASGHKMVEQVNTIRSASDHRAVFLHDPDENLYGMSGLSMRENGGGLLRNNGSIVRAGQQGEGGAPWFFTTHYGVLIDSDDGVFDARDNVIEFSGVSRKDCEYFVIVGRPMETLSSLAWLTGLPPLPPKWSLGFLNSQWGATEKEVKDIVATYREKHIPLDGFILDFDWKAWGEDHYGEWRWNSTSGPGNVHPDEFPNGASGAFAKELRSEGVKLVGILKPRIVLYKTGSKTELEEAASYAEAHGLWYPGEPKIFDYFSMRPGRDLDFSKAETRTWFWQHLIPAFDQGVIGWWNDEADVTGSADGREFYFDSFQFLNMGRMLYEGQREHSNLRVWSLNRNTYLGAQRYGYAVWSGDIQTGFQSMAHQRMRMLATLDLGQPHWSMDTGGFLGHPSAENYARWVEFATFVPIERVHGDFGEKRQPWIYGPTAEEAATKAIRLRYELLPYIYSYERVAAERGIGLVRPLFWEFPDDAKTANNGTSWMFGDSLLVSPVVAHGESIHSLYLPAGEWYDYFRGDKLTGGRTLDYRVDSTNWQDIPLFVRAGSILASQLSQDYVDQKPIAEVNLDIFPGADASQFVYYDDDGVTYAYEHGAYYRQIIRASGTAQGVHVELAQPTGSFRPTLRSFAVRIHGTMANAVDVNATPLTRVPSGGAQQTLQNGQWTTATDRFGPVTIVEINAQQASDIAVH